MNKVKGFYRRFRFPLQILAALIVFKQLQKWIPNILNTFMYLLGAIAVFSVLYVVYMRKVKKVHQAG